MGISPGHVIWVIWVTWVRQPLAPLTKRRHWRVAALWAFSWMCCQGHPGPRLPKTHGGTPCTAGVTLKSPLGCTWSLIPKCLVGIALKLMVFIVMPTPNCWSYTVYNINNMFFFVVLCKPFTSDRHPHWWPGRHLKLRKNFINFREFSYACEKALEMDHLASIRSIPSLEMDQGLMLGPRGRHGTPLNAQIGRVQSTEAFGILQKCPNLQSANGGFPQWYPVINLWTFEGCPFSEHMISFGSAQ